MGPRDLEILSTLYETPEYYVRGLDEQSRKLILHRMSRRTYERSSFLNELLVDADDLFDLLPLEETLAHHQTAAPAPSPVHFIFHFALCGSTLLSRCLDYPGYTMVYKEPFLLHQISWMLRFPQLHNLPAQDLLAFSLSCVQRTYSPSETPIVKNTDSCTNLVKECLRFHADSKGIVLYNSLDTFLLSTLKSRKRRQFVRSLQARAAHDLKSVGIAISFKPEELSDARLSGYVWFSLLHRYRMLLSDPSIPLRSLKMDHFINHPIPLLSRINTYLNLNIPPALIEKMINAGAFMSDSKKPGAPFDASTYQQKQVLYRSKLRDEIAEGRAWVETLKKMHPIDDHLPRPLWSPPG